MSGLQHCNSTLVARQQRAVVDTASNIYYNHPLITIEQNQVSRRRIQVTYMYIRPVHKNPFLEFPKYLGRFILHFDI